MNPEWIAWSSVALNAALSLLNGAALRSLRAKAEHGTPAPSGGVDVVIPARNEEHRVASCLEAILESGPVDGAAPEVFVVDDESVDATARVLQAVAETHRSPHLHLVSGGPRPDAETWLGKNWACAQAASEATGEWLVFLDADVRIQAGAIQKALDIARERESDLLFVIPKIRGAELFERLIDPAFWGFGLLMLSTRALGLLRGTSIPSCTPGAFLVFRREVYDALGGHAAVAAESVEDVALAQRARRAGFGVATCVRPDLAETPTPDWGRVIHVGAGRRRLLSLGGTLAVLLSYAAPWLLLVAALAQSDVKLAAVAGLGVVAARVNTLITSRAFGLCGHSFWLGGVSGLVSAGVWLRAVLVSEFGWQVEWKGRNVSNDSTGWLPRRATTAIARARHDVRAS